jgi:transcriptional regulator with XRE-family HTH domain
MSSANAPQFTLETSYPALVGGVLVKQRENRGLDQGSMAKSMGLSQSTWSRIERGESALTIDHLATSARILGIRPGEILTAADKVADKFEEEKVSVNATRKAHNDTDKIALIGAAAIGAIVALILSR